jgi:hypothetical protein
MRSHLIPLLFLCVVGLSACKTAEPYCPPGSITYHSSASELPDSDSQIDAASSMDDKIIDINGKEIEFDTVIHGPLCNNTLSGTVYVACDIEIPRWQGKPNFFKECEFTVEPGTVIYVAAHNNTAYYKGCASCHGSQSIESP